MTEIIEFAARESSVIDDLWIITMKQITDERGTIREFYRESSFVGAGLPSLGPWVQVNCTETVRGAIRGMHGEDMYKLVAVVAGEAFAAYVDARPGSATYGKVETLTLVPGTQVLVPKGVCNGFQATGDGPTQYLYCFDQEWAPGMAGVSVTPLDSALGIPWPIPVDSNDPSQVSTKDRDAPSFDTVGGP